MPLGRERGGQRGGRAISLRAPFETRPSQPPAPSDRPALRLAVSRGTLGIELDAAFALGPIEVTELSLALPGVRFPVDLSGGVARFRHRRGALAHVAVEAGTAELSAWAAPRLRGLLGESSPDVTLAPFDEGVMAGLRFGAAALAFDVLVAPLDGDLRLIPERARGIGLGAPPHALAMRALAAACAPFGKAVQGAIVLVGAAAQVARHLMPAAGARAPGAGGVRWAAPILGETSRRLRLEASRDGALPVLADRSLRALELAELAGAADDAAYAGDLAAARHLYLGVLERAPRHPEASQRLAWIDAVIGDRPEGALGTIVDAMPAAFAGVLGGALLAAVGDRDGALVAYTRGAQSEPYGPLAALTWLEASRLATAVDVRLEALDQAVARAPALAASRWARLAARLDVADLRGARADAEHLEAAARGAEARHAVWRAAAAEFLARGHVTEASALFERALRYAPDDPVAVVGLARSLRAAGQGRRAVDLFARAVALGARAGAPAHDASIELARGLAEVAGDRPAAIARVRAVPPGLPESCAARFLEGRWRAELGDLAGAALSFGRLRDAVELSAPPAPDEVAAMLVEAAEIEERDRDDLHAAQRSLGLALRLRPHDRRIAASFRRVAALVVSAARAVAKPPAPEPVLAEEPTAAEVSPTDVPPAPLPEEDEAPPLLEETEAAPLLERTEAAPLFDEAEDAPDAAEDERRVQQLTDRLRGDPNDHESAMELAAALGRLGRDLDLLALLSARMEEGDGEVRAEVAPLRREVLLRLAVEARGAGRDSEGELYEMMADADAE